MPGQKKKNQLGEIVLKEYVNKDLLLRIISSPGIDIKLKGQLYNYARKIEEDGGVTVHYDYSQNILDKGRLYARGSLGLQSIKRGVRHMIARSRYYDIDMVNAQPNLLYQYCQKNGIECPNLQKYVNARGEFLSHIQKIHGLTYEESKDLVIRLCYLGNYIIKKQSGDTIIEEIVEEEARIESVEKFAAEMKVIATKVCSIEKDIYEKIPKEKKNKKGSVLSITAQIIENKCLMEMCDFFRQNKVIVGVLCFDGVMIGKKNMHEEIISEEKLKDLMEKCEEYVLKKTGYRIKLSKKDMNSRLDFEIPEIGEYVCSDLGAQRQLFRIEGKSKFQYCNGTLYVFDEKTGLFDSRIETLHYYLAKNSNYLSILVSKGDHDVTENYGTTAHLQNKVTHFVKMAAKNDDWIEETQKTSLGYLLFKDGIYNMKTGTFEREFDPKIVFHARIPWKFPIRDEKKMNKANKVSFQALFEDPKPILCALALALAGNVKQKRFYFCPGKPNAGKSMFVKMLKNALGGYVGDFNAESLAHTSSMDSKDEAAKMRWALLSRFCRILLSNEINMKKELDGNAIKKHSSGGDRLVGRSHCKEEISFIPHYTLFCMLNDIPKILPMDQAIVNRLTYIPFPYVFVDKKDLDKKPYHKQKSEDIGEFIESESFVSGFIHLILDAYNEYLETGKIPESDPEIKLKWTAESKQSEEIIELIKETYDITNDDKDTIGVNDIKKFREKNKGIFQTISNTMFNEILQEELGLKQGRNSSSRFWSGIKLKSKGTEIDFD